MTPRQRALLDYLESTDGWIAIMTLRQHFRMCTISAVIAQGLVLYQDGYVGAKTLEHVTFDACTAGVDDLMTRQPVGRAMLDAYKMMQQVEL